MTARTPAIVSLLLVLVLAVASCGETRDSDLAVDGDDAAAADDTGGDVDGARDEEVDGAAETADGEDGAAAGGPIDAPAGDTAMTIDFGDGEDVNVTYGDLAEITSATRDASSFVDAVWQGSVPPGFDQHVLGLLAVEQAMERSLTEAGASVDDEQRATAAESLSSDLAQVLATAEDPQAEAAELVEGVPYLGLLTNLGANETVLGEALSDDGGDGPEVPCARHILLETEADANDVLAELDGGADFAELAAERSTGPSGPNGGDLGCTPPEQFVPAFADAVSNATVGEIVGPVETEFGFHVITVYDTQAVAADLAQVAQQAWTTRLSEATVEVDPRAGSWDPVGFTVVTTS